MKIRNGFVSNSSSSSFLVVGYKEVHGFLEMNKWGDYELKDEYEGLDVSFDYDGNPIIVGLDIARSYNHSWEHVDVEDIQKAINVLENMCGLKPSVYMGGGEM